MPQVPKPGARRVHLHRQRAVPCRHVHSLHRSATACHRRRHRRRPLPYGDTEVGGCAAALLRSDQAVLAAPQRGTLAARDAMRRAWAAPQNPPWQLVAAGRPVPTSLILRAASEPPGGYRPHPLPRDQRKGLLPRPQCQRVEGRPRTSVTRGLRPTRPLGLPPQVPTRSHPEAQPTQCPAVPSSSRVRRDASPSQRVFEMSPTSASYQQASSTAEWCSRPRRSSLRSTSVPQKMYSK